MYSSIIYQSLESNDNLLDIYIMIVYFDKLVSDSKYYKQKNIILNSITAEY